MEIEHRGQVPDVHPSAYVAPNAVLCGDVHVGEDARVLFGAVISAEDGRVEIGARCVVMEHALIRAREAHPVILGDDVLIGPHAHVNGCVVGAGSFIATGAALFPGAKLGLDVEVRINGVVQVNTELRDGALVPIGWVAVGREILPPDRHDEIWAVQKELDFPGTVYGLARSATARERMERQAGWFAAHKEDRLTRPGGRRSLRRGAR
jgi:carbonic anhydrase/acetyltransferase-like protein (isoleucine patch superfamily)